MLKTLVIIGAIAGSYAGSCVPLLWGGSLLSMSSIFFGAIGGLAGIFAVYKLAGNLY